jgi:hypothetical protein
MSINQDPQCNETPNYMEKDLPFNTFDELKKWIGSDENKTILGGLEDEDLEKIALIYVSLWSYAPYPAPFDFNYFYENIPNRLDIKEDFAFTTFQRLIGIGALNLMPTPAKPEGLEELQRRIRLLIDSKTTNDSTSPTGTDTVQNDGDLTVNFKKCFVSISPLVKQKLVNIVQNGS